MGGSFWHVKSGIQKGIINNFLPKKPTQLIAVLHKLRNYRYKDSDVCKAKIIIINNFLPKKKKKTNSIKCCSAQTQKLQIYKDLDVCKKKNLRKNTDICNRNDVIRIS